MATCAIVGNAKSIFGKRQGRAIDSHDIVIRINRPQIVSIQDQGSKTNIMFVFDLTAKNVNARMYRVVNTSKDLRPELEFWSKIISQETGIIKARPTTGFMAILYAQAMGYEISLYGFDWYQSPTYYLEQVTTGPWKRHCPSWEKAKILDWVEPKKIH